MVTEEINAVEYRCPTCRNVQPWSDECRRCGTDLSLLNRLAGEFVRLRRTFIAALLAKDDQLAKVALQRLAQISPTPAIVQLWYFVHDG